MVGPGIERVVGSRLRQRRLERGLTPAELAERIGADAGELERYEAGRVRIPVALLLRACAELDTPPAFMFLHDREALEAFRAAERSSER